MSRLHIRLFPMFLICSFLIIIGMLFYSTFEGWSYVDSLYFTIITLTTVGYGDLVPRQDISKLFTILYVIMGVGIVLYVLRTVTIHYIEKHTPNIRKSVALSLANMTHRRKHKGDVVLKVKPVEPLVQAETKGEKNQKQGAKAGKAKTKKKQ